MALVSVDQTLVSIRFTLTHVLIYDDSHVLFCDVCHVLLLLFQVVSLACLTISCLVNVFFQPASFAFSLLVSYCFSLFLCLFHFLCIVSLLQLLQPVSHPSRLFVGVYTPRFFACFTGSPSLLNIPSRFLRPVPLRRPISVDRGRSFATFTLLRAHHILIQFNIFFLSRRFRSAPLTLRRAFRVLLSGGQKRETLTTFLTFRFILAFPFSFYFFLLFSSVFALCKLFF